MKLKIDADRTWDVTWMFGDVVIRDHKGDIRFRGMRHVVAEHLVMSMAEIDKLRERVRELKDEIEAYRECLEGEN